MIEHLETESLATTRDGLIGAIRCYGSVAVAFSGGVDSAVVAQAARLALGDESIAVTAVSPSLATGELESAVSLAERIGIRHRVIRTDEFANPSYQRNAADRCYFCKSELYGRLAALRSELGVAVIASGANLDDGGDHRPGLRAAEEHSVRHPLMECGLGKSAVRALARGWDLPIWDKPASPCLSSRIAYGEEATPERVRMIDAAETWLRAEGLRILRVRYHRGDLARLEVPIDELGRFSDRAFRQRVVSRFRELGFRFITIDLEGFRSGSLNDLVPIELIERSVPR